MSATSISQRYFSELPRLKGGLRICQRAFSGAARAIDPAAVVSGRVKTHRSVLGKAYRRGGKPRTWESLGDLIALKAVFPTERGVSAFTDWVSAQTDWHPELDTRPNAPDKLAYKSMQFDLYCDQLVDSTGAAIKLELQVRTAAADAWYVVDHRLRYKGTVQLPEELERKLYRLIVLTELFDEEVEAVIARQSSLPEYAIAILYEQLTAEVDDLIDGYAKSTRPEGLLELVLSAYTPQELERLAEDVEQFLSQQRAALRAVIKSHLHDSATFVEDRDWLYYEPESLLIAERALNRPAMLSAKIKGSDFEGVITPMMAEFKRHLANPKSET